VAQSPAAGNRIVVVGAGFALWVAGRCTAAVRWADVVRVRASRTPDALLALRIEMADASAMDLDESVPGFDLFLDRAAVMLHGLAPFKSWHPALVAAGAAGAPVTIYERPTRLR
jgi:hypothetical protein